MCLCFFLSQLLGRERRLASGRRRVLPGRVTRGPGRAWAQEGAGGGRLGYGAPRLAPRETSLWRLSPPAWVSDRTRAKFDPASWLTLNALLGKLLGEGGFVFSFLISLPVNHVFISPLRFYPLPCQLLFSGLLIQRICILPLTTCSW